MVTTGNVENIFRLALLFRHSIPVQGCMVNEKNREIVDQKGPELTNDVMRGLEWQNLSCCCASMRDFANQAFKQRRAIQVSGMQESSAFRVWHHAENIASGVANAGNIVE
jgi:hypothetical protein